MEEPVEYVGGLSDAERPHAWPFIAAAFVLVALIAAGVVFWNPLQSAGRGAGDALLPHSMSITGVRWSATPRLTGVPVTLSFVVQNTDKRKIDGLTLRFKKLDSHWKVVAVPSYAELKGTSISFPQELPPGGGEAISMTLVATEAMSSDIDFDLTTSQGTTAARVQLPDGTVTSTIAVVAGVRDPTDDDADARLLAIYDSQVTVGARLSWVVHITNTGPIPISKISLAVTGRPPGFQFLGAGPAATADPLGRLQFMLTLPPGGQTTIGMDVIFRQAGSFAMPVRVYLNDAVSPLLQAPSVSALTFTVTAA